MCYFDVDKNGDERGEESKRESE
jgi:hypothetical protein